MASDMEVFIEYEQWVASPDLIRYVPRTDHELVASQRGWWVTPWRGDFAAVTALGKTPELPRKH